MIRLHATCIDLDLHDLFRTQHTVWSEFQLHSSLFSHLVLPSASSASGRFSSVRFVFCGDAVSACVADVQHHGASGTAHPHGSSSSSVFRGRFVHRRGGAGPVHRPGTFLDRLVPGTLSFVASTCVFVRLHGRTAPPPFFDDVHVRSMQRTRIEVESRATRWTRRSSRKRCESVVNPL